MFPIAENPEPFELLALDVDKFSRERRGALPHLERREAARFLHHLVFDRQTMAIPARDKGRAETGHGFRFHDQILEDFVERRSHVHVAVGEGRAIMQDEEFRPGARRLDAFVET